MKATLDTNILISGTFLEGDSYIILEKIRNGEIELILSEDIISEYEEVLFYSEIIDKIKEKELEIKMTLKKLREMSNIVIPSRKISVVKEDSDDNAILECAVEGRADFVVTNDNHLLKLKEFEGIKIIRPQDFLLLL